MNIKILHQELPEKYKQLNSLTEYFQEKENIPYSTIRVLFKFDTSSFFHKNKRVTGLTNAFGLHADVIVACKNRTLREIAMTYAHEFKHCRQFIVDDLFMTEQTKDKLENEAKEFAEEVLKTLWTEQEIYFPSTI